MLMIQDRNLTSHTPTSDVVVLAIRDRYRPCFSIAQQLNERLQQEQNG